MIEDTEDLNVLNIQEIEEKEETEDLNTYLLNNTEEIEIEEIKKIELNTSDFKVLCCTIFSIVFTGILITLIFYLENI